MFRRILLVLCTLAIQGFSDIAWTTPAQTVDTTSNSFTDFQLAEDSSGNAVCAWIDNNGGGPDILKATYSTDYGQTWGAIHTFTQVGGGVYSQLRLAITDDGTGNAALIFAEGNDLYKTYYNNGTSSWVDDPPLLLIGSTAAPFTTTSIKFKGSNAVYATALDLGFFNAPRLFFSTDYGATWNLPPVWSFYYIHSAPYYIDVDFEGANVLFVTQLIITANVDEPIRPFSNTGFGIGPWSAGTNISSGAGDINPKVRFTSNTGLDAIVTWEATAPDPTQIFENHTADLGTTWAGLGSALSAAGSTSHQIATTQNNTGIVVWENANTIEEVHTSDNGVTFSAPNPISGADSATSPQIDMKLNFGAVFWLLTGGAGAHAAETTDSGLTWGNPSNPLVGLTGPFQTQQIAIGSYLSGIIGNGQKSIFTSYATVSDFEVFASNISFTRFFLQYQIYSLLTSNTIPDAVKFKIYSDPSLTNLVAEIVGTTLDFRLSGLNPTGTQLYYVTWVDSLNNESTAVEVTISE